MIQSYGLKTHIWNNNLRCILLLIFFPLLLLALAYALIILWTGSAYNLADAETLSYSFGIMAQATPFVIGGTGLWFTAAFFGHQTMIDKATQSQSMSISQEPRAYRLLENLAVSRGQIMPKLKVIETPVMNAFASGIRDKNYTVTLTRGLMDNLDDAELYNLGIQATLMKPARSEQLATL